MFCSDTKLSQFEFSNDSKHEIDPYYSSINITSPTFWLQSIAAVNLLTLAMFKINVCYFMYYYYPNLALYTENN